MPANFRECECAIAGGGIQQRVPRDHDKLRQAFSTARMNYFADADKVVSCLHKKPIGCAGFSHERMKVSNYANVARWIQRNLSIEPVEGSSVQRTITNAASTPSV